MGNPNKTNDPHHGLPVGTETGVKGQSDALSKRGTAKLRHHRRFDAV